MSEDPIVIVGMARTPMGGFQGDLSDVKAPQLGAVAIKAAMDCAGVTGTDIDEVIMGCVLPAGLGQAPEVMRAWLFPRRGHSRQRWLHDAQQDVRLRHAGRHVRL